MIGCISCPEITKISWFIIDVPGGQRAKPKGGKQFLLNYIENIGPFIWFQNRIIKRKRKYLIRTAICIVSFFAIYNIIKITTIIVPEFVVKRLKHFISKIGIRF